MRQFVILAIAWSVLVGSARGQSSADSGQPTNNSGVQPNSAEQKQVEQNLQDVRFDFDKYDLTDQDRQILQQNADWLKANPNVSVSIAGDADERGDIVYNLALSQKRADVTRNALVSMGVAGDRIEYSTGWGKLYPICFQSDESCWSENRRAHLTYGTTLPTAKVAEAMDVLSIVAQQ